MICNQVGHQSTVPSPAIVTVMVTHIKRVKKRLYLKEHREAQGISASLMGEKLGIERESVYRLEREQWRVNTDKQIEIAYILDIEPQELWSPPGTLSLDAIVQSKPDDFKTMAADILRRMVEEK
jgi:predicted transcriptional regulator